MRKMHFLTLTLATLSLLILGFSTATAQITYKVSKLSINSKSTDFCPSYFNNGIIFCSDRPSEAASAHTGVDHNLSDLYFVELTSSGPSGAPEILDTTFVSKYHDGPAAYSRTTKTLWFSRNVAELTDNSNPDDLVLGLYTSVYSDGKWSTPAPYAHNASTYSLASPSISEDGNHLYFTSDMEGGRGMSDLYESHFEADEWSIPANMGETINTPGTETFASIHPSGRLYFASSEHESIGNLDVFYCEATAEGWSKPMNLGTPINSKADDFGILVSNDFTTGFVTSNRKLHDDLYSFKAVFPSLKNCDEQQPSNDCVTFYEEGTLNLNLTSLQYHWDLGDGTVIAGAEAEHCYTAPGPYAVVLTVLDTLTGKKMQDVATFEYTVKASNPLSMSCTKSDDQSLKFAGIFAEETGENNCTYYWDFGDGSKAIGKTVSYKFKAAGEHNVTLGVSYTSAEGKESIICVTNTIVQE
jgi:hypothetical protein